MQAPEQSTSGPALSRRQFLAASAAGAAALLGGCATDPVTGRKQLVLMS